MGRRMRRSDASAFLARHSSKKAVLRTDCRTHSSRPAHGMPMVRTRSPHERGVCGRDALLVLELLPHQALHHHHAEGDDEGADGHVPVVGALRRPVRVAVVDGLLLHGVRDRERAPCRGAGEHLIGGDCR